MLQAFDIIGPIMIGPSSSHTAGAVRIGKYARSILGGTPVKAHIRFSGSFAKTYKGHGTDKAVIAGIFGNGYRTRIQINASVKFFGYRYMRVPMEQNITFFQHWRILHIIMMTMGGKDHVSFFI